MKAIINNWAINEICSKLLYPLSANPRKCSNTINNSLAVADELFECVWTFCGVGAQRVTDNRVSNCWSYHYC